MHSFSWHPLPLQSQKRVPQVPLSEHSSESGHCFPNEQSSTHTFTSLGPFGTHSGLAVPPCSALTQSASTSHPRVQ